MHEIYSRNWKIAQIISEKCNWKKKTVFMCFNTFVWCVVGFLIYFLFSIMPFIRFSVVNMFVTVGYFGVIPGYFGAAMYILRNTEPEQLQ